MSARLAMADAAIARISALSAAVGCVLLLSIATVGAADVVAGLVAGLTLPAATNYAEEVLPATAMLAVGLMIRRRAEIVVDILTERTRGRLRKALAILASIGGVMFFALLAKGGWTLAVHSIALREHAVAAIEFPIWPMKLLYAAGATVATVEAARLLILTSLGSQQQSAQPLGTDKETAR